MLDRSHYFFLVTITLMSSISLFATDVYLPALPEMAVYFNCTHAEIQLSFSVFLLGLASCQLLAGILSDRFGRKKVLIIGFLLFIVSSLACAFSTTLSQFLFFRLGQAIGGGVGSVMSRALIVDRYDRQGSVKIFSTVFPIVSLLAAIAPLIGGYITYFFTWQFTFIFVAGIGFTILMASMFLDNKKPAQTPKKINSVPLGKWQVFLKGLNSIFNREFFGFVLIICACFSAFRSYIVESPFIFSAAGYSVEEIGRFYITIAITYIAGNLISKKLIDQMSLERVLKIGVLFFITGGLCMIGASHLFMNNPYALIIAMSIVTLGNGFLFPVASTGAMTAVSSEFSGTASGILGASGFIAAAGCINWVGDLCHGDAGLLSIFINAITLVGLFSYVLLLNSSQKVEEI